MNLFTLISHKKILVSLLSLMIPPFLIKIECVYADTIYLNNGGKLKCEKVIKNNEGVTCKFGGSQLIVQKEKIKEIVHEQLDEPPQNTPAKSQNTASQKTPEPSPKISPSPSSFSRILFTCISASDSSSAKCRFVSIPTES